MFPNIDLLSGFGPFCISMFFILMKLGFFLVFYLGNFYHSNAIRMEKGMATHSSILAWKTPWTEETGELQSMGSQRVGYD